MYLVAHKTNLIKFLFAGPAKSKRATYERSFETLPDPLSAITVLFLPGAFDFISIQYFIYIYIYNYADELDNLIRSSDASIADKSVKDREKRK